MKKILVLCMTAVMVMSMLVGCGQNDQRQENTAQEPQTQTQENSVPDQQGGIVEDGAVMDPSEANLIGEEKARQIALNKVDGAADEDILNFDLDYDDGRWVYEGEIHKGEWEYEFEINGKSGDVISWEKDHIYD